MPKRSPAKDSDKLQGVHLWLLLWRAERAVEEHAHRSVRGLGLGISDFGVMEALFHKGPLTVGAIGKKVLLTSGSMTAAVDRLERQGLVRRADDPADRRSCIVHLTDAGQALIVDAFIQHKADMERVFASLSVEERGLLGDLLRKVGREAVSLNDTAKPNDTE